MRRAPIVVHRPFFSGDRRVTVDRDEILGTAYSDHDLVVFLEGAGIAGPEAVWDGPGLGTGGLAYSTVTSSPRGPALR
nr:hypothetical protein [Streptomyces sp. TML10]